MISPRNFLAGNFPQAISPGNYPEDCPGYLYTTVLATLIADTEQSAPPHSPPPPKTKRVNIRTWRSCELTKSCACEQQTCKRQPSHRNSGATLSKQIRLGSLVLLNSVKPRSRRRVIDICSPYKKGQTTPIKKLAGTQMAYHSIQTPL